HAMLGLADTEHFGRIGLVVADRTFGIALQNQIFWRLFCAARFRPLGCKRGRAGEGCSQNESSHYPFNEFHVNSLVYWAAAFPNGRWSPVLQRQEPVDQQLEILRILGVDNFMLFLGTVLKLHFRRL